MADDAPADPTQPLAGHEILALRMGFDLVPEWSNLVERIARNHGTQVATGVDGKEFVVKVAVTPEAKALFLTDMQRTWEVFVEGRKRRGRWS